MAKVTLILEDMLVEGQSLGVDIKADFDPPLSPNASQTSAQALAQHIGKWVVEKLGGQIADVEMINDKTKEIKIIPVDETNQSQIKADFFGEKDKDND